MILRSALIFFLAATLFLLLIRLSSYVAPFVFFVVDGLFPAVSGETSNTSTRHGLSLAVYNLAFLFYALGAASWGAIGLVGFRQSDVRRWLIAAFLLACLCMLSSAMFWPGEQLMNLKAFSLLAASQLLLAALVLWLTWAPLLIVRRLKPLALLFVVAVSYWGLVLPVLHLLAAVFIDTSMNGWLDHLDILGHVLSPLLAAMAGYLHHYRSRSAASPA